MKNTDHQTLEQSVITLMQHITGMPEADIIPDKHFYEELGIDSIKGIELLVVLQEKYQIQLDDSVLPKMISVKAVVAELEKALVDQS